jgi:energy-coupling factor transporter ATP-binding protein EcfA2
MRQRLGIAQAILHKPNLLILDEPTNGLDPEGIKSLRDLLKKLAKEEKMGILISSHNLTELESFCNKITIIKNGEIVERQVEWESSDENVITIDENGNYKIVGETNKTALITATMIGNKECTDTIVVNVVDIQESHKEIVVEPNFTRLSLFRSATFSAFVFDNDTQLSDVVTCVCSGADPTCYTFIDNGNNNWTLKNNKQSQIPLILTFTSGDLITELEVTLGAMY